MSLDRSEAVQHDDGTPARRRRGRKSKGNAGAELVLEATKALLTKVRPEALTQQQVATAAGVNDRMIRYYFGDMNGLLTKVVFSLADDFDEAMGSASHAGRPALERIYKRMETLFQFGLEQPSFFKELIQRLYNQDDTAAITRARDMNEKALARLGSICSDGVNEGTIRTDLDVRFFYLASIGLFDIFSTGDPILRILFPDKQPSDLTDHYLDFVFKLIRDGIRPRGADQKAFATVAAE